MEIIFRVPIISMISFYHRYTKYGVLIGITKIWYSHVRITQQARNFLGQISQFFAEIWGKK